jgi:hypothetical protein
MQETVFRIYKSENKQMIERLTYPKFTAEITFNSDISDLENITLDEDVFDASDIAKAMREAGEFIVNSSK